MLSGPEHTLGPYRLLEPIGSGGMADVYLAECPGADGQPRRVAVKRLKSKWADDQSFIEMLIDEAKVAIRLEHPNIVRAFELGQSQRHHFFSMEYVDGIDLLRLLQTLTDRHQALPAPAALFIGQQLLRGLEYAHRLSDERGEPLGLVHRDVSPPNVLISRAGEVKLADFGLARATQLPRKTASGVIKGKLAYMSPEQALGKALDARSDVFSAGAVLFETLTNRPIYRDVSRQELFRSVRDPSIPSPTTRRPALPAGVDPMLLPAVAADPEQRYQSAAAFENAVAATLDALQRGYGEQQLGRVVRAVLAGRPPTDDQPSDAQAADGQRAETPLRRPTPLMQREDFVYGQHSIVAQVPTGTAHDAAFGATHPTVVDLRRRPTVKPPDASGSPSPLRQITTVTDEPPLATPDSFDEPVFVALEGGPGGQRRRPSPAPDSGQWPVGAAAATAPAKHRGALIIWVAALVGLMIGGATGLLGSRLLRTSPGGERQIPLAVGQRVSIGRWALDLKRVSVARQPPPHRLVALLAITHDGKPSAAAGRFFYLPPDDARIPYATAIAGASGDGTATRLSFRLPPVPEDQRDGPFVLRFAPPDHPSVRLVLRRP